MSKNQWRVFFQFLYLSLVKLNPFVITTYANSVSSLLNLLDGEIMYFHIN